MITDINTALTNKKGSASEILDNAIAAGVTQLTRRDLAFLINNANEGISEVSGNKFIYQYYFFGQNKRKTWYNGLRPNDDSTGESTAWCAGYASYVLFMAGLTTKGTLGSQVIASVADLTTQTTDISKAKSMDVVVYKNNSSSGGHVGFLIKDDGTKNFEEKFFIFGGNQGDAVVLRKDSNFSRTKSINGFYCKDSFNESISIADCRAMIDFIEAGDTSVEAINNTLDGVGFVSGVIDTKLRATLTGLLTFDQTLIDAPLPVSGNVSGKFSDDPTKTV